MKKIVTDRNKIGGAMRLQSVFKSCRVIGGRVSGDLFNRGLCLPSGTQMTEEDLGRGVRVIRSCSRGANERLIDFSGYIFQPTINAIFSMLDS